MMESRRTSSEADEGLSSSLAFAAQSGDAREADELSRKMLSWSRLWFGPSCGGAPTEKENLVRERLVAWLERCIGRQVRVLLTNGVEDVSLATTTPLLTALLGRRAMLELSRRVLNDT